MSFLPSDLYATVERSVPLACVDFVPVRMTGPSIEIGLILRESPFGKVWCHLGGRVLRGESITAALQRHSMDSLSTTLHLTDDPQPAWVYQWFPPDLVPDWLKVFGSDPRKHAIGLSFTVMLAGEPEPRNEALDFAFFAVDALPEPLWPGCEGLFERLIASLGR